MYPKPSSIYLRGTIEFKAVWGLGFKVQGGLGFRGARTWNFGVSAGSDPSTSHRGRLSHRSIRES